MNLKFFFYYLPISTGTVAPNYLDPDLPSHSSLFSFSALFILLSLLLIGLSSMYVFHVYCQRRRK